VQERSKKKSEKESKGIKEKREKERKRDVINISVFSKIVLANVYLNRFSFTSRAAFRVKSQQKLLHRCELRPCLVLSKI